MHSTNINNNTDSQLIVGGGYLYAGQLTYPDSITDYDTKENALAYLNYNITNMDNIALVLGDLQLTINDITREPVHSGNGFVSSYLYKANAEGNTVDVNVAEFNIKQLDKYILPLSTIDTDTENYKHMSYGSINNLKTKTFDLMYVQEDKTTKNKNVWLMHNCIADTKQIINTGAEKALQLNYTFTILGNRTKFKNNGNTKTIENLQIKGD